MINTNKKILDKSIRIKEKLEINLQNPSYRQKAQKFKLKGEMNMTRVKYAITKFFGKTASKVCGKGYLVGNDLLAAETNKYGQLIVTQYADCMKYLEKIAVNEYKGNYTLYYSSYAPKRENSLTKDDTVCKNFDEINPIKNYELIEREISCFIRITIINEEI